MNLDIHQAYARYQLSNSELVQLARLRKESPQDLASALERFLVEDRREPYLPEQLTQALQTFELSNEKDRLEGSQDRPWSSLECGVYRRVTLPDLDPTPPPEASHCQEFARMALSLFDRLDGNGDGRLTGTDLEKAMSSNLYHGAEAAALVVLRSEQQLIQQCRDDGKGITRADLESLEKHGLTRHGKKALGWDSHRLNLSYEGRKKLAESLPPRKPLEQESFDPTTLAQGKSGTCATLSTLIGANSADIRARFLIGGDGQITITLGDGSRQTLSDVSEAERIFHASAGEGERWPALFELAVASRMRQLGGDRAFPDRFPRSYIAVGQYYKDSFQLVTGGANRLVDFSKTSPAVARQKLIESLSQGPRVAGTRWPGTDQGPSKNGIVANHAYAVLKYDCQTDQVTLRNPWRKTEWLGAPDGQEDGRFEMPFLQFYANFACLVSHRQPGLMGRAWAGATQFTRRCLGAIESAAAAFIPWEN